MVVELVSPRPWAPALLQHINHVSKLEFLYGFRKAFFVSMIEKNI